MKPEYEIQKSLVLSTGHIALSDNNQLKDEAEADSGKDLIVYQYDAGFNIYIDQDKKDFKERIDNLDTYSEAFVNLLSIAFEQGCHYLKLDRDGQIHNHLPTFDW